MIETISISKHFSCVRGVTWEGWQLCEISDTLKLCCAITSWYWLKSNSCIWHGAQWRTKTRIRIRGTLAGYYILTCQHHQHFLRVFWYLVYTVFYRVSYYSIFRVFYGVLYYSIFTIFYISFLQCSREYYGTLFLQYSIRYYM